MSLFSWIRREPAPAPVRKPEPKTFTAVELERLRGVHPDLVRVVTRCRNDGGEFLVLEGLRTPARQRELFVRGATKTMNSRHLTGHAVDLAATANGQIRWDWPLYHILAAQMKVAAAAEGVNIEWGGDWKNFPDGPHYQLPWK